MDAGWNPWHGCHKFSAGCQNCYVYRIDLGHGRDPSQVSKNALFDLPVRRGRNGDYKIPPGSTVYTCFSSDFLLEDADGWRPDAWRMMKERDDLRFLFITKRIHRLADCLPADWGEGYENVHICCTMENQEAADKRLPILMDAPIRHKGIVCEPLLGPIDLNGMLGPWAEQLIAGGESGNGARVCDYDWVLSLAAQCYQAGVAFSFKQTGARFKKDGRLYRVPRREQHRQAKKAGIDSEPKGDSCGDFIPAQLTF